jgi:ribosomal 50S subunit-recycling heat shock protein
LITALQDFYLRSKAPKFVKSVILKLMSRILKKLRAVYRNVKDKSSDEYKAEDHLSLQFMSKDFVDKVLEEVEVEMKNEELEHQSGSNRGL